MNFFLLPFEFFLFLLLNYCRFVPSSPQQSKDIIFFSDLGTNIQVKLYLTKHEVPIPIKTGTHHEKPEKFNGDDFKRWQQKMLFYLTTLNLVHVLKKECPKASEQPTNETFNATEA